MKCDLVGLLEVFILKVLVCSSENIVPLPSSSPQPRLFQATIAIFLVRLRLRALMSSCMQCCGIKGMMGSPYIRLMLTPQTDWANPLE